MKVGTKLALGGMLAVLPLAGGLAYVVTQLDGLARANASTTDSQHRAALLALKVLRSLELADEYRHKLDATGDPGYRAKLEAIEARLGESIDELSAAELTAAEQSAASALLQAWRESRDGAPTAPSDGRSTARDAANALLEASRDALAAHAEWAQRRSRETARVAVVVGGGAVTLSLAVIWLLVRSLQRPLRQLIRGTRAVAGGDFEYRAEAIARDELGEVTDAFNHMVDALGALERLKAELVSRVSHELRTPLVAMIETNRLLLDEIPGPINVRQRRMLELHAGAAERLTAMIRDLLDLSTVEANATLDRQPADLVGLTREVIDQLAPLAGERMIALDVGFSVASAIVRCDPRRYQQVVQNLIDNAFSHSPSRGVVHVGLSVCGADALPISVEAPGDEGDKTFAVLRVDDEGPGVRLSDRERIFDKFVQGTEDRAPAVRRGVGLGLSISRQIVAAHGGRIGVGDSALGGASFVAIFPVAREER